MKGLELPFSFYAVFAFILGLIFGSFLNVVIHRVPRGISVVFPGSHCGACGAPVKAFDNIPLISYAFLGGRCRTCKARISIAYPMVELLTGLMFVALVFKTGPSWETLLEFAFVCVMIALIFIDATHFLIPNVITYPAFLFSLIGATARGVWGAHPTLTFDITIFFPGLQSDFTLWRVALFGGALFAIAAPGFWLLDTLDPILFGKYFDQEEPKEESSESAELESMIETERRHHRVIIATMIFGLIVAIAWAAMVSFFSANYQPAIEDAYSGLLRASAGALIIGSLTWGIRAAYFFLRGIEGMGLGDIKMMSVVGAFLGWTGAFGVLLLGSVIGAIFGLILMFRSQRGFKTPLPFGVCLGVASLIVILTSTPFSSWLLFRF